MDMFVVRYLITPPTKYHVRECRWVTFLRGLLNTHSFNLVDKTEWYLHGKLAIPSEFRIPHIQDGQNYINFVF